MAHLQITADQRERILASLETVPFPSVDAEKPAQLLERCPRASTTLLVEDNRLATWAGVGSVFVKDERTRLGLGSFKGLGAAYVIASDAPTREADGRTYATASAGNHGLSVAAGAAAFNAQAVIYLSNTVPQDFADRLEGLSAQVRRAGETYEESMAAAARDCETNGWTLLSDSSWPGYIDRPLRLMEGYLVLMREAVEQIGAPPTHIFLQAGVGGLAGACAAYARHVWGDGPRIIVVEPTAAPAIFESIRLGEPTVTSGPVSAMGRLDCKEPSLIALKGLARDADDLLTISEEEGKAGAEAAAEAGLASTPSGAAGIAGLLAAASGKADVGLTETSRVLVILSEGSLD